MINNYLLPEELLQLDKLETEIELSDESSFFAIIGVDTNELSNSFENYFQQTINNIKKLTVKSDKILNDIKNLELNEKFVLVNLFTKEDSIFIKNLLFFRDFISDYNLRIIIIVNREYYKTIMRDAIDLYNISTFSFSFNTYKIDINNNIKHHDLEKILNQYKSKKLSLNKKQKNTYVTEIGLLAESYGETDLAFKYLNEALKLSEKQKNTDNYFNIKYYLSNLYRHMYQNKLAEKYLLEVKNYFRKKKYNTNYKAVLSALSMVYTDISDKDNALKYANELYELSVKTNDDTYKLDALERLVALSINESGILGTYYDEAIKLATNLNDEKSIASLNQFCGLSMLHENKSNEGIFYLKQSLDYHIKKKDLFMINVTYSKLGTAYFNLLDYKKAKPYINQALNFYEKNKLYKNYLTDLLLLAIIHRKLNNIEESKQLIDIGIKCSNSLKRNDLTADFHMLTSNIFAEEKNYNASYNALKTAIKLINKSSSHYKIYMRYVSTAILAEDLNKAREYYNKAQKIKNGNFKNDLEKAYDLESYGEILTLENNFDEALLIFHKALKLAKINNNLERIMSIEENIALLYKRKGDTNLSIKFFEEVYSKLNIINPKDFKLKIIKEHIKNLEN